MLIKEICRTQLIDIIKRYYQKNYLGQAIKVKVITDKNLSFIEGTSLNNQDDLSSNYKLSIENNFFVMGYLEYDGCLHKFSEKLTAEKLKEIIASSLKENEELNKIEMKNSLRYSFLDDDKIAGSFCGVRVQVSHKKNKVLVK